MEIRTLESVGIQTVESGIKTAKQKITTTEERAEEALLNSTMGEEENDNSFDQDRRNKKVAIIIAGLIPFIVAGIAGRNWKENGSR